MQGIQFNTNQAAAQLCGAQGRAVVARTAAEGAAGRARDTGPGSPAEFVRAAAVHLSSARVGHRVTAWLGCLSVRPRLLTSPVCRRYVRRIESCHRKAGFPLVLRVPSRLLFGSSAVLAEAISTARPVAADTPASSVRVLAPLCEHPYGIGRSVRSLVFYCCALSACVAVWHAIFCSLFDCAQRLSVSRQSLPRQRGSASVRSRRLPRVAVVLRLANAGRGAVGRADVQSCARAGSNPHSPVNTQVRSPSRRLD